MSHDRAHAERLIELFEAVADMDAAARGRWLQAHCDDPALRAEVLALCRSDSQRRGVLDQTSDRLAGTLIEPEDEPAAAMLGTRVGAWTITALLGEGGMATVWLGERADGEFEQEVAIKCLKTALAGPAYLRLFERERQILASLEHPGIAHLLDRGVTAEGVPYLVMPRITGEPLIRACDARDLKLRQRLQLFVQVCDIVQYAHQKLVLHRDLKPGNILIDTEGRPRLLDFGVAGLLKDASGEAAATRALALTPGYAAPEQLEGKPVGVAADVYALGVVLCELLTGGHHPKLESGQDPASRTACWPSRLVRGDDTHDAAWARRRAHKLRGDLDAIVLKCLRQEPGQRYASVAELARDLRSYLEQRPVAAHRGRFGYRARLFMRRHAAGLAAAALVLAVLVGALLWSLEQNRQTRAALAESEAAYAFMQGLFESNLPAGATSTLPSTADLLARGAARARTELAPKPRLQVRLLTAIGGIYRRLDRYEKAQAMLHEAMAVAAARKAAGKPVSDLMTRVQLGLLANQQGRYKDAARVLESVLAQRRRHGGFTRELTNAMRGLARALSQLDEHDRAIALYREALSTIESSDASSPEALAVARNDLGGALFRARRYEESIPVLRRALADHIRLHGRVHAEANTTANNLANALAATGRKQEALQMLREVVANDKLIYKRPSRKTAVHLRNLGVALVGLGQLFEARQVFQQTRSAFLAVFGKDHPLLTQIISVQAAVEYKLGHYATAEPMQRRNLAQFKARGEERYIVALEATNLARTLAGQGKLAEARELAVAAVQLKTELRGADDRSLITSLAALALAERLSGDLDAARGHFERALEVNGEDRRDAKSGLGLRSEIAHVRCLQGEGEDALAMFAVILDRPVLDPVSRARKLSFKGHCLAHLDRPEAAHKAWREALELRKDHLPDDYPDSLRIRANLASP